MKSLLLTSLFLILSVAAFGQQRIEVISEQANLRGTPSQYGRVVSEVTIGETFEVIKKSGPWYLVQTTEYVGWLHGNTVKLAGSASRAVRSSGASSDSSSVYDPPAVRSRTTSSYRTYIRGPRGGCYYINSNGNKTYVDRSMCN